MVYHIDDAAAQALNASRNMRNQMDVAPNTKIVVVTHGDGIDFVFDAARSQTLNRIWGVDFRAQGSGRLAPQPTPRWRYNSWEAKTGAKPWGIAKGTFGSDRNLFLRFARISY
ncbi:MAG TPA: hypothetical protein VKS24_19385 [Bradyrhizobium sp.]|nr:hypothetical protein [Bradyrhizobium sp.]